MTQTVEPWCTVLLMNTERGQQTHWRIPPDIHTALTAYAHDEMRKLNAAAVVGLRDFLTRRGYLPLPDAQAPAEGDQER
jgi:hypothetical protein